MAKHSKSSEQKNKKYPSEIKPVPKASNQKQQKKIADKEPIRKIPASSMG